MRLLFCLLLVALTAPLLRAEAGWAREAHVVVDAEHVRVIIPDRAKHLGPAIAQRASLIYATMAADAGYTIDERLWVWVGVDSDLHNGFSSVIPFPIIQIELKPALTNSTIFDGHQPFERTLVHELAHHLSNDRVYGARRVLGNIFGRVLPNDFLSLLMAYFTVPPHATMPGFWHEGFAIWAETAYADPNSPWAGRGRDPLVHMQWRLDAAAGVIPEVDDWRRSYPRWPYGSSIYLYGTAYFRWLVGHTNANPWILIRDQGKQWPFAFDNAPRIELEMEHHQLLALARADLLKEQTKILDHLHTTALTTTSRLTPPDYRIGAPVWLPDGRIALTAVRPHHANRIIIIDADGDIDRTSRSGHFAPGLRSTDNGDAIAHVTYDHRLRATAKLWQLDGPTVTIGKHLQQPSVATIADGHLVAALRPDHHGNKELVVIQINAHGVQNESVVIQRDKWMWTPALHPTGGRLAWVETDTSGSTLMVAATNDPTTATAWAQVAGRLLHPVWHPNGQDIIVCADHTGIANAYLASKDGGLQPITNVIGGITAAVPSPDGRELAVIDHDQRGPYLARIPFDSAHWPSEVPAIALTWPAPGGQNTYAIKSLPEPSPTPDLPVTPYRGAALIRPRFWSPTLAPVPAGGFGAFGIATDPLYTHIITVGAGVGPQEAEPVGLASWVYRGWTVDIGAIVSRSEFTYADEALIAQAGNLFDVDYSETQTTAEALIGRGIAGLDRDYFAFLRAGISEWDDIDDANTDYELGTPIGRLPFDGVERYVQIDIGYDDRLLYPDGYAPDAGVAALLSYRHSGFGGDLERNRLLASASAGIPIWRQGGHQIYLKGSVGTSDGDQTLQGSFSIGGVFGLDMPRGYGDREATGDHLAAWSAAYRLPVWRPFHGFGSAPFVHRQLVVETFYDAAKVSSDHPGGDGDWYRSWGALIVSEWEVWLLRIQPGLGFANQLDGDEDTTLLFQLGLRL